MLRLRKLPIALDVEGSEADATSRHLFKSFNDRSMALLKLRRVVVDTQHANDVDLEEGFARGEPPESCPDHFVRFLVPANVETTIAVAMYWKNDVERLDSSNFGKLSREQLP